MYRRDLVAEVIDAFAPDSVGLQEPSAAALADITSALPYLGSYLYNERTQPIVYDSRKHTRDAAGGFMLFEGTSVSGSDRDCTWVHVVDPVSGRGYYHYNVHLDGRVVWGQELSVIRLMRTIAARPSSDPFVVTGDFNAQENSTPMKYLRGEISLLDEYGVWVTNPIPLVDTFRVLYPTATGVGTAGGFGGSTSGPKIDYVMVPAAGTVVIEAAIDHTNDNGFYPSDHFPVTAVIEWP